MQLPWLLLLCLIYFISLTKAELKKKEVKREISLKLDLLKK